MSARRSASVPEPQAAPAGDTRSRVQLGRVSTTDAIAIELTRQILDGTLESGTHLREVELSERLGVSRQSLRSALAELVHRGLLRREPNRGVRVPTLTRDDLADLYVMRRIIESEAVGQLARTPDGWPAVEAAVGTLEHLPADVGWSEIVDADLAIHRTIVAALGSPRVLRAHDLISTEMRLSMVPARRHWSRRQMNTEHREMLEAIRTGDPGVAVARFLRHLDAGAAELVQALPEQAPA